MKIMTVPLHASGRIAVIPAALIGGLALAAAGGFYVWREISPPPARAPNVIAPSVPVTAPPVIAPSHVAEKIAAPVHRNKLTQAAAIADSPIPQPASVQAESAVAAAPSIRIEHGDNSGAVDALLLSAWQAYHDGDYDTALQHYGDVLRKDVQSHKLPNRDALLGMAAIAQQRSQDAIAAEYYSQVLALDPRDPDAHAGMSSLLVASGAEGAESRLKLLLEQRPEAAALHFALGNRYAHESRWGDAQQAYFNASGLEPDNARFAFNLAVSLDHLGQGKLAAQHYQRALQLDRASNASFSHAQTQARLDELNNR